MLANAKNHYIHLLTKVAFTFFSKIIKPHSYFTTTKVAFIFILDENVSKYTVWKIDKIYILQILREINFADARRAKSAPFAVLEVLNFNFGLF